MPALPVLALITVLLAPQALAQTVEPAPEAATGRQDKPSVIARRHMVVAAHPLAAEAGRDILAAGGSAVDAAIAVQLVLNLVEPQSSGIGGGAFLLHWDAARRAVQAYDGRETAPAAATPERFLGPDGRPLAFMDAVASGLSVGVPGVLRMLDLAHRAHGRLPWRRLFEPAIALAEDGFPVSPRLHALLAAEKKRPDLFRELPPVGAILRNREFAATLRLIAEEGADAFYQGPLAERIVAAVRGAARHPGDLTLADLATYQALERTPVCGAFRGWTVCGMPPPSSGGIAVLQMLGMLQHFPPQQPMSPLGAHLFAEAGKLAFADRDRYVADPDVVAVPVAALLAPDYVESRARLVDPRKAGPKAEPGALPRRHGWADDISPELPSTSHVSIVDDAGNAVAMTTSIEFAFGSRLAAGGFLLNNQLTDFSFRPSDDGRPIANRVEAGKRPRSSMAPTLVFDQAGDLRLVTGSPGGSRIIPYVARSVVAAVDGEMSPRAAAALPHVVNRNGPTELEAGTAAEALRAPLEALGHTVVLGETTSGLHIIAVTPQGLVGGADPRREGVAVGD